MDSNGRLRDAKGRFVAASEGVDLLGGSVGKLVTGGALLALGNQLIQVGGESLNLASDMQETASLIDNSLGPAAQSFRSDLDAIAEATGRSANELEKGSATIIAMSKNMGFAQQEAANFSSQFTQVALDLGSFFNQEPARVFEDIQSALSGSSETMQKYGIDVRETALKQLALNQGIIDSASDVIPRQERAMLLLQAVTEQASDAMGDAARTSDSYANKSRALQDAVLDLKTAFGEGLIEPATQAASVLADLTRSATEFFKTDFTANGAARDLGEIKEAADGLRHAIATGQITGGAFGLDGIEEKGVRQFRSLTIEVAKSSDNLADFANNLEDVFGTNYASQLQDVFNLGAIFDATQIEQNLRKLDEMSQASEKLASDMRTATVFTEENTRSTHEATRAYDGWVESANEMHQARLDKIAEDTAAKAEADRLAAEQAEANARAMEMQAAALDRVNAKTGDYFTTAINSDGAANLSQFLFESADAAGANALQLGVLAEQLGVVEDASKSVGESLAKALLDNAAEDFAATGNLDALNQELERAKELVENFPSLEKLSQQQAQSQILAEESPFFKIEEDAPLAVQALGEVTNTGVQGFGELNTSIGTAAASAGLLNETVASISVEPVHMLRNGFIEAGAEIDAIGSKVSLAIEQIRQLGGVLEDVGGQANSIVNDVAQVDCNESCNCGQNNIRSSKSTNYL